MRGRADTASDAALLASAATLRWSQPDLTAALAEHVGETRAADDRMWLAAVGWLVHGRAAIGDGRECASDVLAGVARRGTGLLDDPAADRLRIEIAALAAVQREPAVARVLVQPVLAADRPADVRADAFGVLARCVLEEWPAAIGEATRRADVAWAEVGGPGAEIATAALALLSAAGLRRSGHPDSAVDRAADGLARLDRVRARHAGTPSRHLAAALAAEWITALIEAGRTEDAREGCAPLAQQLRETGRPTRQIVLLRLALARALADDSASEGALEQAAQAAADCDTPDLEALSLSALGTLREHAGQLDAALESMRRVVAVQRRDRARSERFRAALRAMSLPSPDGGGDAVAMPPERQQGVAALERQRVVAPLEQQAVAPPERQRAASAVSSRRSPSSAIALVGNLVEPSHPLAGGGVADPWSTGRWIEPCHDAGGAGGRRHRTGPDSNSVDRLAKRGRPEEVGEDAGGQPGLDAGLDARRSRIAEASATPTGVVEGDRRMAPTGVNGAVAGSTPAGRDPGAVASADTATEAILGHLADHGAHGSVDPLSPAAVDPLFGPLEHITEIDADDPLETGGNLQLSANAHDGAVAGPRADVADPSAGSARSRGGIENVKADAENRAPERSPHGGERWLEAALAELDRVRDRPLPDLDGGVRLRAEPTAAGAVEPAVNGAGAPASTADGHAIAAMHPNTADATAVDPAAVDPATVDPAVDAAAAEGGVVDPMAAAGGMGEGGAETVDGADTAGGTDTAAETAGGDAMHRSAAVGSVDRRVAVGTDAVGCVVVVDAVRAGAPVTEGELLREVGRRLTGRMPASARMRCEPDDSALSVVLPGRERSAATDWMHQTLPAVFADMDELGESGRWPAGTTLRAAVHDTVGPVGAQLMQRLDPVTPWSSAPRARHNAAPAAVVRWGVPILAGSGGRRRRADDGSPESGAHREPDASDGRPDAAERPAVEPRNQDVSGARGRHRGKSVLQAAGRPAAERPRPRQAAQDAAGLLASPAERGPAPRSTDGAAPRPTDGAAPRPTEVAAPPQTEVAAPPQTEVAASSPTEEAEFSVEGLGLADLLAGALAAYRGI